MEQAFTARIGLAFDLLDTLAQDRAIIAAHVKPAWSRNEVVRFILTGSPSIEACMETTNHTSLLERRVLHHLGLSHAALLARHMDVVKAICDDVPSDGATTNRPLSRIRDRQVLARVRARLTKLPPTPEIKAFLAESEDGPVPQIQF